MRALVAAALTAVAFFLPGIATATVRDANPSNLASVFAAAQAGDVIQLAPGSYGSRSFYRSFDPRLTIRGPRSATMSLSFNGGTTSGINFQGFTLDGALFNDSRTKQVTIRGVDSDDQVVFREDAGIVNSGIVIANSVFHDYDWPGCCTYEGRISICGCGSGDALNGVTIRNNVFRGGASDGIQDSGSGTRIIHNEFFGIESDESTGVHADPLQVWGSCCHLIQGNYFHDLPGVSVIMSPDGVDHERVIDNVVAAAPGMYPYALTWFADDSSIIRYNTLAWVDNGCAFNIDCGGIRMGTKGPTGFGTKVDHNIVGWINNETGTSSIRSNNLVASGGLVGNEVRGTPTFVGGANPSSYCGFALTPTSAGQGWGARTERWC